MKLKSSPAGEQAADLFLKVRGQRREAYPASPFERSRRVGKIADNGNRHIFDENVLPEYMQRKILR